MIYDITLPLSPALGGWPGDPPVVREPLGMGTKMARWSFGNHAGTHVDAPAHLHPDAPVVRDVDPEALLGPCRVLDLSGVEQITAEALRGQPLAGGDLRPRPGPDRPPGRRAGQARRAGRCQS